MDEIPSQHLSPQTVGSEFVRQYYTLLNKAPDHMHRFYNNYSSYTHGDSQLVVGKHDIHNRIQQLDFKDCQVNITRVDAQASPGDGVVVQVNGELSNGGQPMRRFFQTFVLVALGAKKYYVHNDIFSYQDVGHAEEQDRIREPLYKPEIQMGDQEVQVSFNTVNLNQERNEQDQNNEKVREPGVQMVDQAVQVLCYITMEDEQDQKKEQAEEPGVQTECYMVSADRDMYKEDKQNQTEEPDIQMVDEAVQVACDMVSKHTQPEKVASVKTSSAALQTVELSLPLQINLPQPQSIPKGVTPRRACPVVQLKPKETPEGFEESPEFMQQQRQEQPPGTVIQNEEKGSLPQKQLLFSKSIGGQVDEAQTNTNNERNGKNLISIELDISIYLVDKA